MLLPWINISDTMLKQTYTYCASTRIDPPHRTKSAQLTNFRFPISAKIQVRIMKLAAMASHEAHNFKNMYSELKQFQFIEMCLQIFLCARGRFGQT